MLDVTDRELNDLHVVVSAAVVAAAAVVDVVVVVFGIGSV